MRPSTPCTCTRPSTPCICTRPRTPCICTRPSTPYTCTRPSTSFLLAATLLFTSCELNEIVIAESEDVVVVEMTLRAGAGVQTAVLHRTLGGTADSTLSVIGARIEVTNQGGAVLKFAQAADSICMVPRNDSRGLVRGTCYASAITPATAIVPGERYSLRIQLADGGAMTGSTRVPADFRLLRPAVATCALAADDTMTVEWTSSSDAWVYASYATFRGLSPALQLRGVILRDEPLRLFGLSISNRDTTILFPGEFGLFQRFDEDLIEPLTAIQHGLPPNVTVDVVIAAADKNYVNWERGGDFNPSGLIRIPSVRGDGTGTFGSLVPKTFQVRIESTRFPPC